MLREECVGCVWDQLWKVWLFVSRHHEACCTFFLVSQIHRQSDRRGDVLVPVGVCVPVCQSRPAALCCIRGQHGHATHTQPELPRQVRSAGLSFSSSSSNLLVSSVLCRACKIFPKTPLPEALCHLLLFSNAIREQDDIFVFQMEKLSVYLKQFLQNQSAHVQFCNLPALKYDVSLVPRIQLSTSYRQLTTLRKCL